MSINEKIFKSYDIRGTYPEQLNEEAAYWVGRAYAQRVATTGGAYAIVGRDMRISGEALHAELVRGITDEGLDVKDIGLVPIDAVYFAAGVQKHHAGIMITASHNPKEYNGFKMVLKDMQWIRGVELRDEVLALVAKDPAPADKRGSVEELDIYPDYIKHVLSFADLKKIKPMKVVVDAGNGMAGTVIPLLEPHLPITVIPKNFELDGNFPAHPSNPLMPESQAFISKAVLEEKADLGVIIDGDTDRLFFVDEKGKFIPADISLLLLAKLFLEREPGAGIVYNVQCSKIVKEMVVEWGGRPIISEVGYVFISKHMREKNGVMGGEVSAHYSYRDNAGADSGFISLLILLQLISEDGRKLSEIVAPYFKYPIVPEANFKTEKADEIIGLLKAEYKDGEVIDIDGLLVEMPDWRFLVRKSNTEPLLRMMVEANTQEIFDNKLAEITKFLEDQGAVKE
ncbi:phosphomannomutase/phosphoglucomutase [bacterium]|nr:phosphomannomutase/phosphoglucomutase [bacterium]